MTNRTTSLNKYQLEYLRDNGKLFTIQEMADFLGVTYAITRRAFQISKVKPFPVSCKAVKREWPSIEEYKQVFA